MGTNHRTAMHGLALLGLVLLTGCCGTTGGTHPAPPRGQALSPDGQVGGNRSASLGGQAVSSDRQIRMEVVLEPGSQSATVTFTNLGAATMTLAADAYDIRWRLRIADTVVERQSHYFITGRYVGRREAEEVFHVLSAGGSISVTVQIPPFARREEWPEMANGKLGEWSLAEAGQAGTPGVLEARYECTGQFWREPPGETVQRDCWVGVIGPASIEQVQFVATSWP
jgi:hypothetical protein